MKKNRTVYDSVGDILFIGESRNIKDSVEVAVSSGVVVVEIGKENTVQALEIMNAGSFFGKSIAELDKIKTGSLQVVHTPNFTSLNIIIELENEIVSNTIDIPYSEKLFLSS